MATATRTPPTLVSLPPELLLRVLVLLDAQSLVRLSATCSLLHTLARTDSIWRDTVTTLINRYGVDSPLSSSRSAPPRPTWFDTAAFLLPLSNHLGYFASSKQFSSRIIRVAIHSSSPALVPPSPDAPPPRYTLHAAHLRVRNLHDSPLHPIPPQSLPHGAALDPLARSAYTLSPNLNPSHPYAGLSVDVLEPCYSFEAAMFDVTSEEGAVLCRAEQRGSTVGTENREGVLAAAAAAGVFGGGGAVPPLPPRDAPPPPLPPSHSPFRLRLTLEKVEQRVEPDSAATDEDDEDEPSSAAEENPPNQPGQQRQRNPRAAAAERERLYALFSGRLPRTPWPTYGLVGLEEVPLAELFGSSASPSATGTVFRATGNGAFRGLCEALTLPLPFVGGAGEGAQELPLARVEEPPNPEAGRERAYVSGFRLRAKRRTEPSPPAAPVASSSSSYFGAGASTSGGGKASTSTAATTATSVRRRAEGAYAGMRVLWNGSDRDQEEERPAVTILRAGDEAEGGLVLRLPGSPPSPPDPAPLPTTADSPPTPLTPSASPDSALADAINHSEEAFFPIRPPARPLSFDDESKLDEHGDIRASSIEGMWVGTYGAHGLEFLHLSLGFAEVPVLPSGGEGGERLGSLNADESAPTRTRTTSFRRVVTATKVTGDANVPSGQTTWLAVLPPSSSLSSLDAASPSSPLSDPSALLDGPLPSVSLSHFQHLSALDPLSPAYLALNSGAGPDWSEGTEQGWGRIALPGFTSPSWTGMEVRFLKSETWVEREGEDGGKEKRTVESVEEIHVRWPELHKVGVFKRVRI
ncbi:hypothetical protein JCM8097_001254 [Rhodosporidiobolus ruineniae]